MQNDKLLPCPFCGGEAKVSKNGAGCYQVYCCNCEARQYAYAHRTKEEAIKQWNTRKLMERIVEQLETEISDSDKYIREYDNSKVQKAYNQGMRFALDIVKGGVDNANRD